MGQVTEVHSFDDKHVLTYQDTGRSHIYHLDGKRVPGATTVGACYPKGEGLIRWLIQQGMEEYEKRTKLNKAGAIGRVVHKYAECHMKNEPFNWNLVDSAEDSDIIRGCISQYDKWEDAHPTDELYAAELLVASPSLMVATQIDLVLVRDGDVIVRDYKTGKRIYISALHQTILGRRMLREWSDINCNKLEIVKFSKDPKDIPFEHCMVDSKGLTINHEFIEYPGLLEELERQTVRNIETYRHTSTVEKLLNKYYENQ